MLKRLLFIAILALVSAQAMADAASVRDRIVNELVDDGYGEIRMSRTLLGRLRFVATRSDAVREVVVNPHTGVILRDYVRFLRRQGSGGDRDDDDDDDDDDDNDDDDDDDNSGSGSSNSGRGSSNSGSGSSNSGSGSSNSGSGSGDDDD